MILTLDNNLHHYQVSMELHLKLSVSVTPPTTPHGHQNRHSILPNAKESIIFLLTSVAMENKMQWCEMAVFKSKCPTIKKFKKSSGIKKNKSCFTFRLIWVNEEEKIKL